MARYIDADELKRLSIKFGEEQGKQRFSELLCEYIMIERALYKRGVEGCYNSDSDYAELKKKYTEDKE